MNCQSIQNRIDESFDRQNLSAPETRHLQTCRACQNFDSERKRFGELLRNLETVNAPNDFNFRLKAKLRETKNGWKNFAFARKLVWLAPASLAALILSFVVLKTAVIVPPPNSDQSLAPVAAQIEPTAAEQSLIEIAETSQKTTELSANIIAQNSPEPMQIVAPRERTARRSDVSATVPRKNQPNNRRYKEQIISRDVTFSDPGAPLMPPGFSSPLETVKKTDAKELLRTFGIETNQETTGLRVVTTGDQAARRGLQKDDVIEKINEQIPASLSNDSFKELKLTVRRQTKIEEINIPLKP